MDAKSDNPLDVATKAVSFNVMLQLLMRVSSFALNGFVLRYIQPELLGVVNLRLTLLYSTILFLSREAFRRATLTSTSSREREWTYIFNTMWMVVPVGGACAMILSFIWVSPLLRQPDVPWDWVGVASYSLASLIELMAEPLWVLSQLTHHVSIKVVALGIPQILKCGLVAVGMAFYSYYGVLVFAIGQLAYSLCYLLIYYVYFTYQIRKVDSKLPINSIFEVLPHSYNGKWLDGHLLGLSFSFFKQSFLKQLLTDGERYIMTLLGLLTFAEQGVYDIITNLGSLIARIVFLPIEESFYVYFASVLIRGDTALVQSKAVIQSTSRALSLILKLVSLIALVILVFGNSYSELALDIYGGQILSQGAGPILLRSFCVYLLFLAVNGMTECFMFSSMSQERVNRYNNVMVIFSIIFLCAAALLIQIFGSVGFIFANCINMATRIVYSTRFIYNFYKPVSLNPLWDAVPSTQVWLSLLLSFMITVISMNIFCCQFGYIYSFIHVFIGSVCLLLVAFVVLFIENDLCQFLFQRLPHKFQRILQTIKVQTIKYDKIN